MVPRTLNRCRSSSNNSPIRVTPTPTMAEVPTPCNIRNPNSIGKEVAKKHADPKMVKMVTQTRITRLPPKRSAR